MSDSSDEPDWVVEQASADKRTARAPSSSGDSPSIAGDDEPPEAPDDASDLWSSDEKPAQEEEEEEEEEAGNLVSERCGQAVGGRSSVAVAVDQSVGRSSEV